MSSSAADAARVVVVRGGTLVTMDAVGTVVRGDLRIEDGAITAVGDAGDVAGAEVIEADGCHVLPGFVQGHVHLGQALLRGLAEDRPLLRWLRERVWPLEAAHDPDSAYWSAMLGIADCLASGTTTIQDIGLVHHTSAMLEAVRDTGLRAIAGKCLMDVGEGVPPGLAESTDDAISGARALVDAWHGAAHGRITMSVCPRFILSCSERLWSEAVSLAADAGLPLHTHLLEHPQEEAEVEAALGVSQMEYLDRLGVFDVDLRVAHGVWINASHVERLAGRHLSVCHCPSANLKLGSGIADLAFLRAEANIDVGIGTDGAPCNNDMDVMSEMRLAGLLQQYKQGPGVVTSRDIVSLATREGARAIGLGHAVGSLERGKRGDVVVLDLRSPGAFGPEPVTVYDRIVYGAARDAVRTVLVDGHLRWHEGGMPDHPTEAVLRRAAEAHAALVARAALVD